MSAAALFLRFVGIMTAEGNMRSFREAVEGEPLVLDYMTMIQGTILPLPIKRVVGAFLGSRVRMLFESNRKSSKHLNGDDDTSLSTRSFTYNVGGVCKAKYLFTTCGHSLRN